MDMNGLGGVGMPYGVSTAGQLPAGFGMPLAMNDAAMKGYADLTEAQKEEVILRCKDAGTKEKMQEIVDSLAPGTDVREVYEEERESMF